MPAGRSLTPPDHAHPPWQVMELSEQVPKMGRAAVPSPGCSGLVLGTSRGGPCLPGAEGPPACQAWAAAPLCVDTGVVLRLSQPSGWLCLEWDLAPPSSRAPSLWLPALGPPPQELTMASSSHCGLDHL